jgi:nitrate/nitrite transporter NarK
VNSSSETDSDLEPIATAAAALETTGPAEAIFFIEAGDNDKDALLPPFTSSDPTSVATTSTASANTTAAAAPATSEAATTLTSSTQRRTSKSRDAKPGLTLLKTMTYGLFWFPMVALGSGALFWTGINIYAVSVFEEHGRSAADVSTAFLVTTFVALGMSSLCGLALDHMKKKERIFLVSLGFGICANVQLRFMSTFPHVVSFGVLYGCFVGAANAASVLLFAAYFGLRHIGQITGAVTAIQQVAGGCGPLLYSTVHHFTGHYNLVFEVLIGIMALDLIVLFVYPFKKPKL